MSLRRSNAKRPSLLPFHPCALSSSPSLLPGLPSPQTSGVAEASRRVRAADSERTPITQPAAPTRWSASAVKRLSENGGRGRLREQLNHGGQGFPRRHEGVAQIGPRRSMPWQYLRGSRDALRWRCRRKTLVSLRERKSSCKGETLPPMVTRTAGALLDCRS